MAEEEVAFWNVLRVQRAGLTDGLHVGTDRSPATPDF